MKRTTKKLSGVGLELFLRRYYASFSGLDDGLAQRLSKDGAKTFASLRVRRVAWHDRRGRQRGPLPGVAVAEAAKSPTAAEPKTIAKPATVAAAVAPALSPGATDAAAFDPYAIGLIPTYQREGADGLRAKLGEISALDNLRRMARSQQIALPGELRGADADIDAVRGAIVAAVAKRIADRRAAAG